MVDSLILKFVVESIGLRDGMLVVKRKGFLI